MPFENSVDLKVSELDLNTRYRFAEIELRRFVQLFHPTEDYAAYFISKYVMPYDEGKYKEMLSDFYELLRNYSFRNPRKDELIFYLRYHDQGYKSIQSIYGISPRTVAKIRFQMPYLFPTYRHWTPEMLSAWNVVKRNYNLWNENLIHLKEN